MKISRPLLAVNFPVPLVVRSNWLNVPALLSYTPALLVVNVSSRAVVTTMDPAQDSIEAGSVAGNPADGAVPRDL
jgi:hypothetical protein